jgi:hypothetical protein
VPPSRSPAAACAARSPPRTPADLGRDERGGRAEVGGGSWRLRARSALWRLTLEGEGDGPPPHILPVPVPAERRSELRSRQHLAGRIRVVARRGSRVVLREESPLAGLEHGLPG